MTLVLRDVHLPPAPSLWPPAPGWWWLSAALAVIAIALGWWQCSRRRRQHAIDAIFDAALAQAHTPAERIGACSELLRRAARRRRSDADRLDGEAWLQLLDSRQARFSDGDGRLLVDGAYRRDVAAAQADAVVALARTRFRSLMGGRR